MAIAPLLIAVCVVCVLISYCCFWRRRNFLRNSKNKYEDGPGSEKTEKNPFEYKGMDNETEVVIKQQRKDHSTRPVLRRHTVQTESKTCDESCVKSKTFRHTNNELTMKETGNSSVIKLSDEDFEKPKKNHDVKRPELQPLPINISLERRHAHQDELQSKENKVKVVRRNEKETISANYTINNGQKFQAVLESKEKDIVKSHVSDKVKTSIRTIPRPKEMISPETNSPNEEKSQSEKKLSLAEKHTSETKLSLIDKSTLGTKLTTLAKNTPLKPKTSPVTKVSSRPSLNSVSGELPAKLNLYERIGTPTKTKTLQKVETFPFELSKRSPASSDVKYKSNFVLRELPTELYERIATPYRTRALQEVDTFPLGPCKPSPASSVDKYKSSSAQPAPKALFEKRQGKSSRISRYGKVVQWKPACSMQHRSRKMSYNTSRRIKYDKTELDDDHLKFLGQFYEENVKVDNVTKSETQDYINKILEEILSNRGNGDRFDTYATEEGSLSVGVKVGKIDEADYSVDIMVNEQQLQLSDEPFMFEYKDDDIDRFYIDEVSTTFIADGKRYFPNERRPKQKVLNPFSIREGYIAVSAERNDYNRFRTSCFATRTRGPYWLLPYEILREFHHFVGDAVNEMGDDNVKLNKGGRGPAITLTVQQDGGPNISVDISLKLTLPNTTLSVTDYPWPRRDTRKWLTEEKIDQITSQELYLVPKGDKYWKVSFGNCEYELLRDIDNSKTWRKACLRIMKKKLMQWKSKSKTGLKGLSSYLLKITLLWMCEILPHADYWVYPELANRHHDFLQEFAHRLKKKSLGEYFNPSVNLLENKDDECIDELVAFLEDEISSLN